MTQVRNRNSDTRHTFITDNDQTQIPKTDRLFLPTDKAPFGHIFSNYVAIHIRIFYFCKK